MKGSRLWLAFAGLNGLMGVAAGAFGAHGVSDPQVQGWLRTGAEYQMIHAVAAMVAGGLSALGLKRAIAAAWAFGAGAMVFGGSLYLMGLTGARILGAVTPVGGVLLLVGWGLLVLGALARAEGQS